MPQNFSIQANTYTFKSRINEKSQSIIDRNINYIIPIYQRPYSWKETQVEKFISDIFKSFWGNNKTTPDEPMFIGTMQLSKINKNNEQDIIDGQQRITTFLILIKVLQLQYGNCKELNEINLNWLSTEVNNGKQQVNLEALINSNELESDFKLNRYLENAILINNTIKNITKPRSETHPDFNIDRFVKHLCSNVYFVVIETKASLTKTLQIFDAINTTGLDLNAGDVFKIRMYEYLNPKGDNDEVFNQISALYEKIDTYNEHYKQKIIEINDILSIYQYYLIAKYNLPTDLYTFGTDLFYDKLFETLFNINKWEHFKGNVENGKLKLVLDEISTLIDIRFEWEKKWRYGDYGNALNASMVYLWRWSRYSKYSSFIFLYLNKFRDNSNKYNMLFTFSNKLVKLYLFYSLYYQKSINNIKGPFNSRLLKELIHGNNESIHKVIDEKINSLSNQAKEEFYNKLNGEITYSRKFKNILCRISAVLEEDFSSTNPEDILSINEKLFKDPIDIEHIQPANDENKQERTDIIKKWGANLNSIGNLVVLEQSINRSINNRESQKLSNYKQSKYAIVSNKLVANYDNWDIDKCIIRRKSESKKIYDFILKEFKI